MTFGFAHRRVSDLYRQVELTDTAKVIDWLQFNGASGESLRRLPSSFLIFRAAGRRPSPSRLSFAAR